MRHILQLLVSAGLLCLLPSPIICQSVPPFVDQLCYTESFTEYIRVENEWDPSSLTFQDKLRFRKKSYVKDHHVYFKTGKIPVHDVRFREWTGIFPKWYRVADVIRSDENGIRAYFRTDNSYLPGGWSGATYYTTEHGYYNSGEVGNQERYYFQHHTGLSDKTYHMHRQNTGLFGYISQFTFLCPTSLMLEQLKKLGFTVMQHTSYIQVSDKRIRITWHPVEKWIKREFLMNSTPVKTVYLNYTFHTSLGVAMLEKETTVTHDILENGACVDVITEKWFTGYETTCGAEEEVVSRAKNSEESFLIVPNPAEESITLVLPETRGEVRVAILSMDGQSVMNTTLSFSDALDVSHLPAGLYTVRAEAGHKVMTAKLIKK